MENPSNTGTACVTPSPESRTIPVVRPEEYLQRVRNGRAARAGGRGGGTRDVQRQHGLHRREQRRDVECVEEYLRGDVAVAARVERGLCEQDRVLPVRVSGALLF